MKKHTPPKDRQPDPLVEMYRKAVPDWDARVADFQQAFPVRKEAASTKGRRLPSWNPDIVINTAGRLLKKGAHILRRIDEAMDLPDARPAMGMARGSGAAPDKATRRLGRFDSHQVVDGREMITSAILSPNPEGGVDINILLADAGSGRAVTPHRVTAYGPNEEILGPSRHVDTPAHPAHFPQASPGGYIFQVEWASGSVCHLQLEIEGGGSPP